MKRNKYDTLTWLNSVGRSVETLEQLQSFIKLVYLFKNQLGKNDAVLRDIAIRIVAKAKSRMGDKYGDI